MADGWLPIMFIPERAQKVWGDDLKRGLAKRSADLPPLDISAGGMLAIGDDLVGATRQIRDMGRPGTALYVGGMGARGKNFYNDLAVRYGFEQEAERDPGPVPRRQEGRGRGQGAGRVAGEDDPRRSRVATSPSGSAAYKEAGVTVLNVNPVGSDPVKTIDQLREIVDAA